jgi:hypothetical protein
VGDFIGYILAVSTFTPSACTSRLADINTAALGWNNSGSFIGIG